MATQTSQNNADVWRLQGTTAVLQTLQLAAVIDLLQPHAGLSQLVYYDTARGDTARGDTALSGFVLGITPGASAPMSSDDVGDVFLRGNDLVVSYSETAMRPFSLQVYWRATAGRDGALLLDTILSLQTDLLESFPAVAVETQLSAASAWQISNEGEAATKMNVDKGMNADKGQQCRLPADDSDGLLLRSADGGWSYAEMTHPEDRGGGRIERSKRDVYLLRRQLGGGFLEKGVIRRLRVRGVLLPQENDLESAARYLASFATEQPPLTV